MWHPNMFIYACSSIEPGRASKKMTDYTYKEIYNLKKRVTQSQGQRRDKQGQKRDNQGHSLSVPAFSSLSLTVSVSPCLSLLFLVLPCLTLSAMSLPIYLYICYTSMSTPGDENNILHQYEHSFIEFPCKSHCSNGWCKPISNFFFNFSCCLLNNSFIQYEQFYSIDKNHKGLFQVFSSSV